MIQVCNFSGKASGLKLQCNMDNDDRLGGIDLQKTSVQDFSVLNSFGITFQNGIEGNYFLK